LAELTVSFTFSYSCGNISVTILLYDRPKKQEQRDEKLDNVVPWDAGPADSRTNGFCRWDHRREGIDHGLADCPTGGAAAVPESLFDSVWPLPASIADRVIYMITGQTVRHQPSCETPGND
jgi:hypothetical protein